MVLDGEGDEGPKGEQLKEIDLQPLDDDCKLLGTMLDTCLKHEIGETLFSKASEAEFTGTKLT